jgi:prepilin-type N-terminal cleavage/methylation domain-containing protein
MCRAAFTLPEILVVLFVVAILLGMAISRIGSAADRAAVHAAVMEAAAIFGLARNEAVYRRASVAVSIDTTKGTLVVSRESTVVVRRDLSGSYGVRISTSRDSIAFDARGLGVGIANLSLIARRGHAADTAFLSRLGRVRY